MSPKSLTEPSADRTLAQMGVLLQFLINRRRKCVFPCSLWRETVPRRAVKLVLVLEAKPLLLEQLAWCCDQGQVCKRGMGPEWGWMRRVGEAGDTQLPSEQIFVPGVCSLGWNSWIYRSIIEKHLIHDCLISGYLLIFAVTKIVFYVTPSYCLSFTYCSSYCLSLWCIFIYL